MLQSIWNLSIKGACKEIRHFENEPSDSFSGIFDIKNNCANNHKDNIILIDQFSSVDTVRKLEGSSVCFHNCKYKLMTELEFNRYKQGKCQLLSTKDMFSACIDLLKKIKNVSCTDKFF